MKITKILLSGTAIVTLGTLSVFAMTETTMMKKDEMMKDDKVMSTSTMIKDGDTMMKKDTMSNKDTLMLVTDKAMKMKMMMAVTKTSPRSEVAKLQQLLIEEGFLIVPKYVKLGYYGPLTKAAYAKYSEKMSMMKKDEMMMKDDGMMMKK